ncbi:hypothetical protein BSZ39_06595 [Bowdeniella nasicola]|uniref:Methylamine utilisation protein MauE domain-containing protein n=2 Tax=Bowdeniella nasicola TaxID=208480 RepID=A0A1Q5Q2C8_9ACTO|nr:hypothetical protein BSZ39_06595 [Bowdeniella nasicola]
MVAILCASGIGKLVSPTPMGQQIATWRRLAVPKALAKPWAVTALPYGELAIALGLLLPGIAGTIAAVAAVILVAIFTLLVASAVATGRGVPCHCFGAASAPMSQATVFRNIGFLVLASLALVGHLRGDGPIDLALRAPGTAAIALLVVAAAALSAWGFYRDDADLREVRATQEYEQQLYRALADQRDELEVAYVRHPVPDLDVVTANGEARSLLTFLTQQAGLVISLSSSCSACQDVIDQLPRIRKRIGSIVAVYALIEDGDEFQLPGGAEGVIVLRDPQRRVARVMRLGNPGAVLLGTDAKLAGGPVKGSKDVIEFVEDIAAELRVSGLLA